jgi:SAM-dependent methyltransferase
MADTKDEAWLLEHSNVISESLLFEKPVLELGCGTGRDTIILEKYGPVVATDISVDALQAQQSKSSNLINLDISKTLPFKENSFCLILASLSLHYFSWKESEQIISEIRRVLIDKGFLIIRVNSVNDVNHGANSGEVIDSNFYRVGNRTKRFFDHDSIEKLFLNWTIIEAREKEIDRYEKPKFIWEVVLRAA